MMLRNKLQIPMVNNDRFIERPALVDMLNEGLNTRLTFISAPAGYGKTTLLSVWAKHCGYPVYWVSLDSYDNDPISFWTCILSAVAIDLPKFGEAASLHLPALNSNSFEPFIVALINEMNGISGNRIFVLDDFHLIDHPAIHPATSYLLEHLPAHFHLYVASRYSPSFPVARLLSKGQMVPIEIEDMRFQPEEGYRFMRDRMRINLSNEEAELLVERTEGWVSGLHLAVLSLKKSANPSAFIREFSGQHRDISQYLMEELLSRLPEESVRFLLLTSILERMNASLCEEVTGHSNAQDQLEVLVNQNLFIIRLDAQGDWFRYHHLFADFLQAQFRRRQPERWLKAHKDAAHWLEQRGFLKEAVEHWLGGEDYEGAARLIEKHLPDLQNNRSLLMRWLGAMPEAILSQKPSLQLLDIKITGEAGNVTLAENRLKSLESRFNEPEWKPWIGTYYFQLAELSLYRRNIPAMLRYVGLLEQHNPQGSPLLMIAGNSLSGLSYEDLLVFFNDLNEAEPLFLKCIEVWETKIQSPFLGYFYLSYADVLYEWNRTEEAEIYWNRLLHDPQWEPFTRIWFRATLNLALLSLRKGEIKQASALVAPVEHRLNTPEKKLFVKRLAAEKAYLAIHSGMREEVDVWLETCDMKYTDPIPLRYREYYILARALIEVGQIEQAIHLLERLFQLFEEKDWRRDKVRALILQSIALHQGGNEEEALIKLELALHLAEPQGYVRSFTDEGERIAPLLIQYLHGRQRGFIRQSLPIPLLYVKKLLHKMNGQLQKTLGIPFLLTEQEIRILQSIEMGLKNREIAEHFNISSETVKKHIKNIYFKLEANSRLQAVKVAKELRLL